jgi:hypothetical protein
MGSLYFYVFSHSDGHQEIKVSFHLFLKNIDNLMTAEGVGLTTALRVLCNVACPPPPVEGNVTNTV